MAAGSSVEDLVICGVAGPVELVRYADLAAGSRKQNHATYTPHEAECMLDRKVSFHRTFYAGSDMSSIPS